MAYDDAWAALNLEMPERIPPTEYSITEHWTLIEAVTGIAVAQTNSFEEHLAAGKALMDAWGFGLFWNVLVINQYYKGQVTQMRHAAWATDGSDFDDRVTGRILEMKLNDAWRLARSIRALLWRLAITSRRIRR